MKEVKRDSKGVWIPKDIWENEKLTWMEKLFLVEIQKATIINKNSVCTAPNSHFAKVFNLSRNRCSQIIVSLEKKEYTKMKYIRKGEQIVKRQIYLKN